MQKPGPALVRITAPIVLTVVMLLSVRSAHAEVSLGELMRKCLLLENYWALKLTQDTTGSTPNDGSTVCFGYFLAFRGLQGAVIGTDCASTQSCRRTLRFPKPQTGEGFSQDIFRQKEPQALRGAALGA